MRPLVVVLVGAMLVFGTGCRKKVATTAPAPPAAPAAEAAPAPAPQVATREPAPAAPEQPRITPQREEQPSFSDEVRRMLNDAYFDYDRFTIRADARETLSRNGDMLQVLFQKFPAGDIVIEGHADERGSAEYNLGLADRRAVSAKELLTTMGLPSDRVRTVSYGKERPQCTESDENCWQRNRRVHFVPRQ